MRCAETYSGARSADDLALALMMTGDSRGAAHTDEEPRQAPGYR
jgi:hypothetical protein